MATGSGTNGELHGVERGAAQGNPGDGGGRALARDAREAVLLGEAAMAQALDVLDSGPATFGPNVFGEPVRLEPRLDPVARVRRAAATASAGERVALLASSAELAPARGAMREIASQRLGVVFHAFEEENPEAALSLADLGWAVLFASDVEESLDLTLVARRAAEDSGTPFVLVHDYPATRRVEPIAALHAPFVEAFVGPASARMRRVADPAHPVHAQIGPRAFAERVPFALASALRDLEALTGRRRDVLTRSGTVQPGHAGEAALMLVGLGALGDVLIGEVPGLRALGYDVGAVKLTAFRPFPGPRCVRMLARAHAIAVLEQTDEPLAQSNPLTRDLKAAFADALTWAPDYPGIGRVPRIHSGVAPACTHDLESRDLEAVVRNLLAGETGRRFFMLRGDAPHLLARGAEQAVPPGPAGVFAHGVFHARGFFQDVATARASLALAAAVLGSVLGLRARGVVRAVASASGAPGTGSFSFDLSASVNRPVGVHAASAVSLIVLDDASNLVHGNPVASLGRAGTLALPSSKASPEGLWAEVPPYVKAIVHDREGRVMGWEPGRDGAHPEATAWRVGSAVVGVMLAVVAREERTDDVGPPHVDPSLVEREVAASVASMASGDQGSAEAARACGSAARRAFEAALVVPRGLVEQDQDAIRLGRMDARAASQS